MYPRKKVIRIIGYGPLYVIPICLTATQLEGQTGFLRFFFFSVLTFLYILQTYEKCVSKSPHENKFYNFQIRTFDSSQKNMGPVLFLISK